MELQSWVDVGTVVPAGTGDAGGAGALTEADDVSESVLISEALVDWGV